MRIFKLEGSDEILNSDDGIKALLKIVDEYKVEIVVYNYILGCYDGYGEMLIKRYGKWYRYNLCHCSCSGPLERLYYRWGEAHLIGRSFERYARRISPELLDELMPLFDLIKEKNL